MGTREIPALPSQTSPREVGRLGGDDQPGHIASALDDADRESGPAGLTGEGHRRVHRSQGRRSQCLWSRIAPEFRLRSCSAIPRPAFMLISRHVAATTMTVYLLFISWPNLFRSTPGTHPQRRPCTSKAAGLRTGIDRTLDCHRCRGSDHRQFTRSQRLLAVTARRRLLHVTTMSSRSQGERGEPERASGTCCGRPPPWFRSARSAIALAISASGRW